MEKSALFDAALEKMMNELDEVEGSSATAHSLEDCTDPLTCGQHEAEEGEHLTPEKGSPAAVTVEVHKMGLPSMEGEKAEDGLSPEDVEELRKLLK